MSSLAIRSRSKNSSACSRDAKQNGPLMHDALEFLKQCAQSGTLLSSLCALVILPATVWRACRFVAPHIVRMKDDPGWQAPFAAVAAGIPGALFAVLAASALVSGLSAACLAVPVGRIMFGLIIAAM